MARFDQSNAQRKVIEHPNANGKKLIVPDTSVLLHDPQSLLSFQDNDVYLVRPVLAQLDRHKKGQSDVARNARQVTRMLDTIFKGEKNLLEYGASMAEASGGSATGKLFFQMESLSFHLPKDLLDDEADRRIIQAACRLREKRKEYTKVVLVTKDANMRYAALGVNGNIAAEDYLNDKVLLKDSDVLPKGYHTILKDFWESVEVVDSGKKDHHDFWRVRGPLCQELVVNECVHTKDTKGADLFVRVREHTGGEMVLERITDYRLATHSVFGITARNIQQCFAFSHLMNSEIDLVVLLGDAGTGKSLLALAAGFTHLPGNDRHHHLAGGTRDISEIIMTRAMVPVGGEEIGFLPGTVDEKFGPWMNSLEDTREALSDNATKHGLWDDVAKEKQCKAIKFQPISLTAGRTFANKFVIVDEAQNLTPTQAKMLVTRAGNGAKFVVCGNLSQIDTPFLDEKSSGLAYLVMRMKGREHIAHVILEECVRSRLAALGVQLL
mgnify:FL=1